MATLNQNSSDILRDEILADARRESEEILRRAKQEAEALVAKAAAEVEKLRRKRLEQAKTEAARRSELILATIPVEVGRLRAARVEALLRSVHDELLRRLNDRAGFDYREAVITLASAAVRQIHGRDFVVKLSPADRAAIGEGLADEIARRTGHPSPTIAISNDATLTGSGPVIQDSQGYQVWDNRLPARLQRMWPELRRQIATQTALVAEDTPKGGVA